MKYIILLTLALAAGCATPRVQRVRFDAIKTDVIVYEKEGQVSRQCRKHIERWQKKTGKIARLDDGRPALEALGFRGCNVPPLYEPLFQHILTSLETIDNGFHELCHALGGKPEVCDKIHFDGRSYPGRTVTVK